MHLTPEQRLAWRDALLEAFPSEEKFKEMIYFHLGETPDAVAPGVGLNARIVALLQWAEGSGQDARLLARASAASSTSSKLRKLTEAERPAPVEYVNEHQRLLGEQINERFQRRAQLDLRRSVADAAEAAAIDAELTALDAEILDLQRSQRSGPQLTPGEILGKRYVLAAPIGDGSFGRVWRAYDRIDRRNVAVKVLHGHRAQDLSTRERFFRGAKQMALLRHPNIVGVVDRGGEDRGYYYFVMELVEGSLREAVARGLPMTDRIRLIIEVAQALQSAHQAGVVHRDVKPDNILVDAELHARLTDFDLVHVAGTIAKTQTAAMGTPGFTAPEVVESAKNASAQSDIYGLAITTIFAIAGEAPSMLQLFRDPFGVVARLDCPLALKPILARAVAWRPRDRHASALDFGRMLEAALPRLADPLAQAESTVFALLKRLDTLDDTTWGAIAARFDVALDALAPTKAPRRRRSIDLVKFIGSLGRLDELVSLLLTGGSAAETPFRPRPDAPNTAADDWEQLLDRLCHLDDDAFRELVFYLDFLPSTKDLHFASRLRHLGRRIEAAIDLLSLGDAHPMILDELVAVLRRRGGTTELPAGADSAVPKLWGAVIHAKMLLVVDRIARAPDAPARPILDELEALVRDRRFARLVAEMEWFQIQFFRAVPRHASSNVCVALPLLGRLFTLAVELPDEWRRYEGDPSTEAPHTPRTEWMNLYRALCRLTEKQFAAATTAVFPQHLLVSRDVERARRVLAILLVAERWRVDVVEMQRLFSPWLTGAPVEMERVEDTAVWSGESGPLTLEAFPWGAALQELCFRLGFDPDTTYIPEELVVRILSTVEHSVIHRELVSIRTALAPRWPSDRSLPRMESVDRQGLLERLRQLDEEGWVAVIAHFGLSAEYLSPDTAPLMTRRVDLGKLLMYLPSGPERFLEWLAQRG